MPRPFLWVRVQKIHPIPYMTIQNPKMLILQSNKTEMKKILTWNQRIFEVALQITSCCQSTKQLFKYLFSTSKDIILVITVCMNWNKVVLPWQKWLFAKTWSYKYLSSYSYTALNGPNSLSLSPEISFPCAPGLSAVLSFASWWGAFWWTQVSERLSSSWLCWLGGPKRYSRLHLLACRHLKKIEVRRLLKGKTKQWQYAR